MKKKVAGVLILFFVLILASCGANPKALAKESYDLSLQALGALFNEKKAAELEKKMAGIEKKVANLSESDKKIYNDELARLTGAGLGGLFDAASKLQDAASSQDAKKAVDSAKKAADLLNSLKN